MNQPPRIPGIRPIFELEEIDFQRMQASLSSGIVSNNGPMLRRFEEELAAYLNAENIAVVSSGFEALLLALKALDNGNKKVVLPSYTYIATLNSIVQSQLIPVLCDICPDSFTIDPEKLEEILCRDQEIGYVVPVNVFGVPPDMEAIVRLARKHNVLVAYDNAHGFGTECFASKTTKEVEVEVFSLHATKTLPAIEGGLVVSENINIINEVKRLRNHGISSRPGETAPGFNSKMDELRAIVGLSSIRNFESALERRRNYALQIREAFSRNGDVFISQSIPEGVKSNFQNIGVLCPPAKIIGLGKIIGKFAEFGIGVRSYFDPPMHHIGSFGAGSIFPVTQQTWERLISFPIHARMTEEDLLFLCEGIDHVATCIRDSLKNNA